MQVGGLDYWSNRLTSGHFERNPFTRQMPPSLIGELGSKSFATCSQCTATSTYYKKPIPKSLINSDQPPASGRRCNVRNHDFVSDGFLALIVAGLVVLCSSLLVIVFS